MANKERLAIRLGSAAIAVVAATSVAHAGAFAIREQSACGQGASFAGVAAGCSLSSMFWNPATLMGVEGLEIEKVSTGVFPTADVDIISPLPFAGSEGDIAQDALVPAFYAAYRLNESLVFGLGVNSPYGLVTKYDATSPLRAFGVAGTSKVFSINVNPAIAVQLNDWLALALGAQVQFVDVRLTAQAIPGLGITGIEGDDVGVGLTAGIELTPMPGTQIGLGYRSRINHELEGELRTAVPVFDVTGEGFDLPDVVTFGVRQRVTDAFRVLAGAEWSNWSRFETVTLTGAPAPIPLPFDYEDGWFFSVGGEYDVTQRLTVRAGVAYELSPLDDDTRTYRLPDSDRLWLSAGGSFRANERWSFDLGYTFISAQEADLLPAGGGGPAGNGPFTGESEGHVHIISAAIKTRWGGAPASLK
jgi:long-chain fatty acid transport protein